MLRPVGTLALGAAVDDRLAAPTVRVVVPSGARTGFDVRGGIRNSKTLYRFCLTENLSSVSIALGSVRRARARALQYGSLLQGAQKKLCHGTMIPYAG